MSREPLLLRVLREPVHAGGLSLPCWDLLLRQAAGASMTSSLRALLDAHGVLAHAPTQARTHLDWTEALALRHAQAVRWEVRQIRCALDGLGIPLVLLKGAAYTMAGLPAAQGRMYSDIDILVPKGRLDEVEAALMMHGWVSTHLDAYDQRYYRNWMHELPPMQNVRRETLIDVHHAILPETAAIRPNPGKLRAAAVAVPGEDGLLTLAPPDMVLHSAVHLFYGEFEHGLRDLVDIHLLLAHFGPDPGFWESLPERAHALELGRPLYYALRHAARLLGTPVPAHVQQACACAAPHPLLRPLMDFLLARALLPDHESCAGPASALARFALYIRANWLRMPPLMLARHLFHKAFLSPGDSAPTP